MKKTLIAAVFLGASCGLTNAAVLYHLAGPVHVSENNTGVLVTDSLSRDANATGTLYFRYTVTNPQSNRDNESATTNYYAGMSFYVGASNSGGLERLGIGNGWGQHAYSSFGTAAVDFNSANPEPFRTYQEVRSTDVTTIIYRIDFNSGANDNVTVWLNPDLGLSEGSQSAALTTTFSADASFSHIYLREGGQAGDGWTFSNVAIAESFAEIAAIPEPSTALLGGLGILGLLRRRRC